MMDGKISIPGPVGPLEIRCQKSDEGDGQRLALIAHPHPLMGGTPDNKVVTTLAKAARRSGCTTLCPAFRGIDGSGGVHDHGIGETDDMLHILQWAKEKQRGRELVLMGFSFGAYVQTRVHERLLAAADADPWQIKAVVLAGLATGMVDRSRSYASAPVSGALVVHGEQDEVVPLAQVLDWARPQQIPVLVLPGAGHFFHHRLQQLLQHVQDHLQLALV